MFKSTLRRLSIINSVVFLLIFMIFGTILYGYVAFRVFDKVDDSMKFKAESFKIINGRLAPQGRNRFLFDSRILIMLRDAEGQFVNLYPSDVADHERLTMLASEVGIGEIKNREFEDHAYRIVSLPYHHDETILQTEKGDREIKGVIAVSIIDSEVALLRNLSMIIIFSMIIGMLIIVLAGHYLARRAMIPIQAAWEKQQQFVADASHELRTPLTVIKSNAELMLRHPNHSVEEESIRVTNIVREVRRMTKLVADLLTLARSDANQTELNISSVNVKEQVLSLEEQFKPLAEVAGLTLEVDITDQLELFADRERLYQLLIILLDNALKYTPPPGRILISGSKQGGHILLAVEDSGCGIPPEDLPRIFDRFYRGDKVRSREQGGTGLGLSIAKWIVERHGGKIDVDSKPGTGTTFSILLPVKAKK